MLKKCIKCFAIFTGHLFHAKTIHLNKIENYWKTDDAFDLQSNADLELKCRRWGGGVKLLKRKNKFYTKFIVYY